MNTQLDHPKLNPKGSDPAKRRARSLALAVLMLLAMLLAPALSALASTNDVVQRSSTTPSSFGLSLPKLYLQTMNNCGPATLSMVFAYYGVDRSQQTIGDFLRPYQNPTGNNDDKSVSMDEMLAYAESAGFAAFHRVDGNLDTLRAFVSHNVPVVVQSLMTPTSDIGHFRIVTAYDDAQQRLVQTDPYLGPNLTDSYSEFQTMWQPFGYEYLVIVPKDKAAVVESILGNNSTEAAAWQGLLARSQQEQADNAAHSPYPLFNEAKAYYHLGQYAQAKAAYESIASQLPPRTLWYQLEPIQIYQKLGDDAKVLAMSNQILTHGNRAYPELYYIEAQVYIHEGNVTAARDTLKLAVFYNKNYQVARDLLQSLGS